jgi:hypothetical protein
VRRCFRFTVFFLRSFNSSARFRNPSYGLKSNPVRLIPPNGYTITIPVLNNVVGFKKFVIPNIPLLMRSVIKDYSNRWLT